MKNNIMMKIAMVLLATVMITSCAVSGTFARYTSTATGSSTARIASWDFKVGGTKVSTNNLTFNLFNTVFDTNGSAATNDADVSDGDTPAVIAPGTWGYFDIVLKNDSEVTARYSIAFSQSKTNASNGLNIKYLISTGNTLPAANSSWVSDIASLNIAASNSTVMAMDATKTIRVFWKWDFSGGNNSQETTLGENAGGANVPSIRVTATVTASQVD